MFVGAGFVSDHNFHPKMIYRGSHIGAKDKTFDGAKISLKRFSIDPGSNVLAILKKSCQGCTEMRYSLINGTCNPFSFSQLNRYNYSHCLITRGRQGKRKKSTERIKSGCKSRESDCMIGKKDFIFEEVRNQYRKNFLESGLKNK